MDKERVKQDISALAKRFSSHLSDYEDTGYLESQLRTDFLDELFETLGWDLTNKANLSPFKREVLVEKGDTKGRPDYSFRVDGEDRFFVEAKSCSKGTDKPDDIFQAKKYGYNTRKVNVVVLTDFKTFKVFDTSLKPDVKLPKVGLLFELDLTKFNDSDFDKLLLFSHDQVITGSLDSLSSKDPSSKRFRIPVDAAFLEQMTGWREELAKDVYKNNSSLSARSLNDVVQHLLDRLVFIRILEDRKIIESKTLKEITDNWKEAKHRDIQAQLNSLFRQLNEDFNGEIFKPHQCETIVYDSKVIAEIIGELYYPSPYDFAIIGVDLLGIIYEKYLGKTIRLTEKRVKVEEKPEVRKAGGVYYTPRWVVEYIVGNTVGKIIENKNPDEIAKLHFLDPACGSGSFLIGSLEKLFEYHLEYYLSHGREAKQGLLFPHLIEERDADDNLIHRLSIEKKSEILKNNIYGVDVDPQAVEITVMSLYIKVLEGEQTLPHNKELLPTLSNNVRCGNSLIGYDFLDQKRLIEPLEKEKTNPFEWRSKTTGFGNVIRDKGGFDAIVGNPPYIRIQTMKEWAPREVEYFSSRYKTAAGGNYDIYVVFVERAVELLSEKGMFGFILPHKFFQAEYGKNLRQLITEKKLLREIINFADQQVFDGVSTYTCLLFLSKAKKENFKYAEIKKLDAPVQQLALILKSSKYTGGTVQVDSLPVTSISSEPWQFGFGEEAKLLNKMKKVHPVLSDVCDKIFQGIITGSDKVFLLEQKAPNDNKRVIELYSKSLNKTVKIEREMLKPLLKGSLEIRRYKIAKSDKYVIFPYSIEGQVAKLIPFKELENKFPLCADYLTTNKKTLEEREHGKWRCPEWYGYSRNQNLVQCGKKKILTPSIAKKASFVYDNIGDYYFVGSGGGGGGGYGLSIRDNIKISPQYLVGLLNSKLLDFIVQKVSTRFSGGFFAYNKQYIQDLPIVLPSDKQKEAIASQINIMVDKVSAIYKEIESNKSSKNELLDREAKVYEEKIDQLAYDLYGITEEEKQIVESNCK